MGARRGVARGTAGGGHLTCWSGLLRFQMVHAATAAADAEQPQLGRSSVVASLRQPAASHANRARSVGFFFSARAASSRAAQTSRDVAELGVVARDEVQASAAFPDRGRGGGSRQKPKAAPLPCKSLPLSGTAQQAQKCISSPLRGNGRGAGVSAGRSSCEGAGGCPPAPLQSMARTRARP